MRNSSHAIDQSPVIIPPLPEPRQERALTEYAAFVSSQSEEKFGRYLPDGTLLSIGEWNHNMKQAFDNLPPEERQVFKDMAEASAALEVTAPEATSGDESLAVVAERRRQ